MNTFRPVGHEKNIFKGVLYINPYTNVSS